jgi:hypothetical protein
MVDKMHEWITTGERPLPSFVIPFAKSASGSGSDDDEDDDEDEDDEDDDEDPDEDKSDEELRAELKATRASLAKANGQSAKRRKALRAKEAELEAARKPKPKAKKDDDEDGPDLDTIRHEARAEGSKEGIARAKRAEAKSSLLAAGVNPERVAKAVGLLDLDELDLDDDGLDGIDDEIEDLRKGWPELFAKKRTRRQSVAGERDADDGKGERRGKREARTASERAADKLLGRS